MQTVGIVLNIGRDQADAFETGFRDMEEPIWDDLHARGELVMATLSRQPSEEELSLFTAHLGKYSPSEKQKGLSDILWVLLNTAEFSLNH